MAIFLAAVVRYRSRSHLKRTVNARARQTFALSHLPCGRCSDLSSTMVRSSILWDPYCLAYLSWEDIEALMLREKEPPRRRVYASRGGLLNLDSMSSHCFRRQFRFEKADFPVLVRALKMPQYITSAQGVRVTATEALCICLRRLAYPNRLCDLQEYFGRHYSVVSSVSNKVLYHIEKNFALRRSSIDSHPARVQFIHECGQTGR
ncbi:hypothetical protein HPB52_021719 [Rhipicephalus sanguineus]|uniref:Uncharacterized protein n=1 Tax=Rhipicephalus sanguineus TaxID=34632 RepID=A0A9D4T2Q9_RHISA|nr:hypothetical protein HPB52_021719 [Rhipicephalus sanguineus]